MPYFTPNSTNCHELQTYIQLTNYSSEEFTIWAKSYQCCGSGSVIWCLFDPWIRDPGWVKNQGHIFKSVETIFWVKILKFSDADPGWKNSDSGWKKFESGISIPGPQHWKLQLPGRKNISCYWNQCCGSGSGSTPKCHGSATLIETQTIMFLSTRDREDNCIKETSWSAAFPIFIFMLAQLLLGCSGSPIFTLGTTYIDDHVKRDTASVYLGVIYSMVAFGPVLGKYRLLLLLLRYLKRIWRELPYFLCSSKLNHYYLVVLCCHSSFSFNHSLGRVTLCFFPNDLLWS